MKVLIVCSKRKYAEYTDYMAPFVYEQSKSIENAGCKVDYFLVTGDGVKAYFKAFFRLKKYIKEKCPDIIHAHFGLCGLLANLQRKIPVVTTYHGSDINNNFAYIFSKAAIKLSGFNIFVSQKLIEKAKPKKNFELIPCGVDTSVFLPSDKKKCRKKLSFSNDRKYVLFPKMFYDPIKNYPLAKETIENIDNTELVEFIGYTREEAAELMNACDAVIMTSFSEGSPQFIKEAMACNCPIVSVDVGDVKDMISGVKNCFICKYDANELSDRLKQIFQSDERSNGNIRVSELGLDNKFIAQKILKIYCSILKKTKTKKC